MEAGYVAALPFLGAWSALELESDYVSWILFGGWLLATMNIYIYVPIILQGMGRNWVLLTLPLVRIAVLAFKQTESEGSLWAFFLDEALIETGSLMIGFAFYFLFGTGISGNTAWSEMGIPGVLLIVGLFLGSVGGFVMASLEQQPSGRWDTIAYMGLALGLSVWQKIGFIVAIKNGRASPDAVFTENFMILALTPLAYMILLPALFAIRSWIADEWF